MSLGTKLSGYYLKQGQMTPAVNMQAVLSRAKQGERE